MNIFILDTAYYASTINIIQPSMYRLRQPVCNTKQKAINTHIPLTFNLSLRISNKQKILDIILNAWTLLYTYRSCTMSHRCYS